MKAYKESRAIDPLILDFGTTWRWVVTFKLRPPYPWKKNRQYPSIKKRARYRICRWLWTTPRLLACPPAAGTGQVSGVPLDAMLCQCLNVWRSWVWSWQGTEPFRVWWWNFVLREAAWRWLSCAGRYVHLCRNVDSSLYRATSEVLLGIQAARDAVSFGTFRRSVVPPATRSCILSYCWTLSVAD